VAALADDEVGVRTGAEVLLRRAGPLAAASLEAAASGGLAEQRQRAGELLRALRTHGPATVPAMRD